MVKMKKLRSKKGATMALSLVIAIVISTVSLAISALVAQVAINQVNTSKTSFKNMTLKNTMYTLLNDYYQQADFQTMFKYESSTSIPSKSPITTYTWTDPGYYCGNKHKIDGVSVTCPSTPTSLEFAYNANTTIEGTDTIQGTAYFSYPVNEYEKSGQRITQKTKWFIVSSQKVETDVYQVCISEYKDFKYGDTGLERVRCKVSFGKRSYSMLEMETSKCNGSFHF